MLRSYHHLRGFVKLVLWDVCCVNGCGSFRLGYVGVGFGGNCDCRYGIIPAVTVTSFLFHVVLLSDYLMQWLILLPCGPGFQSQP